MEQLSPAETYENLAQVLGLMTEEERNNVLDSLNELGGQRRPEPEKEAVPYIPLDLGKSRITVKTVVTVR